MRYMLDTNICIYAIKHSYDSVLKHLKKHKPQDICISSITYSELVYGAYKSNAIEKNRIALSLLLSNIEIVDFDSLASEKYGETKALLEKQGTPIGSLDMLIASHALANNCTLVTNNTKEFERIKGLKIENWTK